MINFADSLTAMLFGYDMVYFKRKENIILANFAPIFGGSVV